MSKFEHTDEQSIIDLCTCWQAGTLMAQLEALSNMDVNSGQLWKIPYLLESLGYGI